MSVVDPGMRVYYEARAAEYDDWFKGTGAGTYFVAVRCRFGRSAFV